MTTDEGDREDVKEEVRDAIIQKYSPISKSKIKCLYSFQLKIATKVVGNVRIRSNLLK